MLPPFSGLKTNTDIFSELVQLVNRHIAPMGEGVML
jgi:hypothetical protein